MSRRIAAALALPLAAALALAGCSDSGSSLADEWEKGTADQGYVSGDGTSLSIPAADRTDPVVYAGETETGETFGSEDTLGSVTVVNFWYAGCAPCRAEAPDLVQAAEEFAEYGVQFVGVNTRDEVAQAAQFSEEFGVEYPSIMDNAGGRAVQRAFAGQVPLNAVPTTLVLDSEGRVAHRVLGQLAGVSQLRTLLKETLAEEGVTVDEAAFGDPSGADAGSGAAGDSAAESAEQ